MEESIKSKVVKGGISKVVGASVGTLVGKFVLLADPSLAAGTALILDAMGTGQWHLRYFNDNNNMSRLLMGKGTK